MSDSKPTFPATPSRRARIVRGITTVILLIVSVLLLARTTVEATRHDPIDAPLLVKPIGDPKENIARQHDVLGTFATGKEAGDRVIIVQADGIVRFQLVGPLANALAFSDTYRMGMMADHACVVTAHTGVIEATDIDHFSFFGDMYQRTK
jgi:hypothetical protein